MKSVSQALLPFFELLNEGYEQRKRKNPSYSLRAYAQFLGVPRSTTFELMKGKISGQKKTVQKVGKKLGLTDTEILYFSLLIEIERTTKPQKRSELYKEAYCLHTRFNTISEDDFSFVARWYHFAVMELLKVKGASGDPSWIAKKLQIKVGEAKEALEALEKLNIVKIDSKGKIYIIKDFVSLPSGEPLSIAQDYHQTMIEKAMKAVKTQPKGTRNFSSMTFCFNKAELKDVDQFIKKMRMKFADRFVSGQEYDSVYSLNIQFVRLDRD